MKLIACIDKKRGIGKDNMPLFSIPEDLKFFKNKTLDKTVVMGRKTLDSLPGGRPLAGRENVVLSRDPDFFREGVRVCRSLDELAALSSDDVYVIGGGEIYRELLPLCDTAYITEVDTVRDADTFLPDLAPADGWQLTDQSPDHEENGLRYRFMTYRRINQNSAI